MARKATVLHVIAHMEKGGAERQLRLLVEASSQKHVIAVLPGGDRPSSAAVELIPDKSPCAIYKRVHCLIRKHNVDIVQLWLPYSITIPALFAARRARCHVISGDRRKVRNYGFSAVRDRLTYVNHLFSDVVIPNYPHFPPRFGLRRLLRIPGRTRPIFNGVELTPSVRPIDTTPDRLLFVGRLVEQKRTEDLLHALPELLAHAGIAGLDVVGEGPQEAALRSKTERLGLSSKVTFHGYCNDWSTMFDPNSHFLVLPSVSEGMSNTVFEAIAQGFLPIVRESRELRATLVNWDVNPVIVDMSRTEALVDAVAFLTKCPPRTLNQRARAMQVNLQYFSVARMTAAYDEIYEQLLRGEGNQ